MNEERFDTIDDIYERFHQNARRCEVDPSLLDVHTPDDLARARALVTNVLAQKTVTQHQLAKRTGIKPSAISAFVNDKWGKGSQGTLYTTASELAKAVDQFLKQRDAEQTSIEGFVWTRFAQEVDSLAKYVMKRRKIGAFVAPAGSGKSAVLWVLKEAVPGAVLVVVLKCRSSVKAFLQLWARSLGLQEHGRAEDIQDRIVSCLAGSDRLVLVDEAHKLQVATLDVIREVWDQVRIPILLAGTPSFYTTLTSRRVGVQNSELMDQLYSRVAIYRNLSSLENPETGDPERLFTVEDIRKVFARGCVRLVKDGVDFLCRVANNTGSGGLRTCADLVQVVVDLFPGEPVTAAHLDKVLKLKLGTREAAFRMEQAGIASVMPEPAKVAVG